MALVSPPGKFSQRTDKKKIVVPDLDRTDMQYGDQQELVAAQRVAKGNVKTTKPGERRMTGEARTDIGPPPWLAKTESARPLEPITAGLPMGAGPGPEALTAATPSEDVRAVFLEYARDTFGNADASEMLHKLFEESAAVGPLGPLGPQGPSMPAGGGGGGSWGRPARPPGVENWDSRTGEFVPGQMESQGFQPEEQPEKGRPTPKSPKPLPS